MHFCYTLTRLAWLSRDFQQIVVTRLAVYKQCDETYLLVAVNYICLLRAFVRVRIEYNKTYLVLAGIQILNTGISYPQ